MASRFKSSKDPPPNDIIYSDSADYISLAAIKADCLSLVAEAQAYSESAATSEAAAEASATSASEFAASAATSAGEAADSATAASSSASSAEASAAAASSSADRAETAASSIEDVKDDVSSLLESMTAEGLGALPTTGGTMTGSIEMSGQSITGLATPTEDTDAVNKSYVDGQITEISSSLDSVKSAAESAQTAADNAQTAANTAQSTADNAQSAASTAQEAAEAAQATADGALMKTGGTMTGSIEMSSQSITGLASPTADTDAANKSYVDGQISEVSSAVSSVKAATETAQSAADNAQSSANGAQSAADTAQAAAEAAQSTADGALMKTGGTMTGPIEMSSEAITGLPAPSADTDAANKAYVDAQVQTATDAAGEAKDAADTAQTTADSAVSAASTAQDTADNAASAASAAQTTANACLPLAGGTMTGKIESSATSQGYYQTNGTTGTTVSFGVGSGGYNRGVYDDANGRWMVYSTSSGNTYLTGEVVYITAYGVNSSGIKLYYSAGDTAACTFWHGAGFITNANKQVCFTIPFSKPIVGSPTVTMTGGLKVRQGGYFFGCDSSTYVAPNSWSITARTDYITVTANYDADSSTTNNAPCGVAWSGTIVFS